MENEQTSEIKILIVDDREENLILLETILKDMGAIIFRAMSGQEALKCILDNEFALILLDVQMPEMDGFETAELIRSNSGSRSVPIIFITAISKEKTYVFRGYESGAVDYLYKPLEKEILRSKVRIFIDLYRQSAELKSANDALNRANSRIIDQQKNVIEEERFKVLLQMAGTTAHEFSQPLMLMTGSLELLEMDIEDYDKAVGHIKNIRNAGKQISDSVTKIRNIPFELWDATKNLSTAGKIDGDLHLLSVEDSDNDYRLISSYFSDKGSVRFRRATSIAEAMREVKEYRFDLIFLDYQLPDGTGLDAMSRFKAEGVDVPVVAITGQGDDVLATELIRQGAYDYLNKSVLSVETLNRVIASTLERFRLKQEISKAMKKMAEMSVRDELTGLFNRRYMKDVIEQEFNRAVRYKSDLACLIIDLDYFKQVNDTYGHICGDMVLTVFSERLQKHMRSSDYAFRYGGEEFLLLLPQTGLDGAVSLAEIIRDLSDREPFRFEGNTLTVTVSIGVGTMGSCFPEKPKDLIAFADKALYLAKSEGRNCVRNLAKPDDSKPSEIAGGKGVDYFKANLSSILDKTRKASVAAIKTLIRDSGGDALEAQTRKISGFITLFGDKLNLSRKDTDAIIKAAILHDTFRILMGDDVLDKKQTLTQDDTRKIQSHPYMLAELTDLFDFFTREKSVLLSHHENYDGSGYPDGLRGNEIPLGARLFAITNAFLSMTSDRPYREKVSPEKVVAELVDNAGKQFDPELVLRFLEIISENSLLESSESVVREGIKTLRKLAH